MKVPIFVVVAFAAVLSVSRAEANPDSIAAGSVPADIEAIFHKPIYKHAIWGLLVVALDTGRVQLNLGASYPFFIGSVRKVFSVGELLNQVGPAYRYNTSVYRRGPLDRAGVLHGDLILLASGDLTMGGRTAPDGTIAVSNFDHNEADSLGNAVLTRPNPLAGYMALAQQLARRGIREVTGEVIIDDRLFQPFNFRNEFYLRPIFVNDDVVDLIINPTVPGKQASVRWRPVSAALGVKNTLVTGHRGSKYTLQLEPELPRCIGRPACIAQVTGKLPKDFVPPLVTRFPLIQTFRIVQPSSYARTVLINALQAAGVKIDAAQVRGNPAYLLLPGKFYPPDTKLAELEGLPYSQDAKLILKVSYNIGADTSLLLFGLTQGVDNMADALEVERTNLRSRYGIAPGEYHFVDGSGGGPTTATNRAVTRMLVALSKRRTFPAFLDALPILGEDGSLASVTDFESDRTLAGAKGQVRAKTGTFVKGNLLKGQALGGYITTRSGTDLAFELVVNNVEVSGLNDVIQVFQDEGTVSAILWRDN
ncbi:MAG: D-alanyl-D-alanine carboxypeptidase/D-alanyl-D-alanine-endopeptidase [Stellaceae bacterium]